MNRFETPLPSVDDDTHWRQTLQTIALLIGLAATVLAAMVHLSGGRPSETATTALVAGVGWTAMLMLRFGYLTYVPHFTVFGVLIASSLGVMAFGSIRAASGLVIVATIAAAGIFLERRALVIAVLYGVVSLGLLAIAQYRGLLPQPDYSIGLSEWLTHSATLVVTGIMVYYSRLRSQIAFTRLEKELALRKCIELERDRSEERSARIFRTSPSPMMAQLARTGAIVDVNPAFERSYGYTRDQLIGHDDTALWGDLTQRAHYIERLTRDRSAHNFAGKARRADGSTFDALVSSELGTDPGDKLVITTIFDVSAQVEALEKLRRSEERFAKAFNFSPLNMTITRLSDGSFIEINRTNDNVQGYTPDDLAGETSVSVGSWLSPGERARFVERLKRVGRIDAYETRMRHKDGSLVDTRLWAVLIDIDGEDCILSCTVSTTEEKRREALLLGVAQGMTGETGEAFFNALTRHMAQTLGADLVVVSELRPDQKIQTLSVWKDGAPGDNFVYDPQGTPCSQTLSQTTLFATESDLGERFPGEAATVCMVADAYVGQSLRDQDGSPIGVLKAMWRKPITLTAETRALMSIFSSRANAELIRLRRDREIHDLNTTLEQRVSQRTAELEKLNAELDSFAYSVSHDLKSPLRSIDGFTQLLGEQLKDRLQPDEAQLFERVLAATRRMSTLIADLLALARVSQGALELSLTDLSTLAETVLQSEQARHPTRRLRWRIEPGMVCRCDARLARIALDNLLGNAVKYTRDQSNPLIEVGRVPGTQGRFFVRDNGVGFDMTYADKLFKPFQRLHMPSEFEGTGIGLATVRRIVERHGGSISGDATVGSGARFLFDFGPVLTGPISIRWTPSKPR